MTGPAVRLLVAAAACAIFIAGPALAQKEPDWPVNTAREGEQRPSLL